MGHRTSGVVFFRLSSFVVLLLVGLAGASLAQTTDPTTTSSAYDLRSLFSIGQRSPFSDRKCLMCRFSVSLVNYALKTRRGYDQVDRIANTFCQAAHLESALVCSQVSKLFNREITKVLTFGLLTPDQVCGLLSNNTCGHFHSPLDDWEVSLEASHQIDQDELKRYRAKKPILDIVDAEPYRVLHISDTHIDLNYKPGAPIHCQEPLCCQAQSTPADTQAPPSNSTPNQANSSSADAHNKAGHWGSYGQCDLPLWTFEATLKFLGGVLRDGRDIEYIIWTGDIQPHDVWSQDKRSAIQLYDTVFSHIFKHLPKAKILPTLGNHEMIPVDSFSPSNLIDIARDDSPVWLYKKLDSFWSRWLPKDTVNTITRDGFYATTVRPGLKVVSLNTNFCHSKNFWLFINSTDPGQQLQWLVHELQLSELADERVHIIGHIPPGSDDCMKVWSKNYNQILRRFKGTITGQFFGHTHNNEFEMFYEEEAEAEAKARSQTSAQKLKVTSVAVVEASAIANAVTGGGAAPNDSSLIAAASTSAQSVTLKPIGVGFVGPSITTFINMNPSFRIYTVEPKRAFMPVDFETYFMNLTAANMNATREPEWTSAGMFSKTFGLNDTSPESVHELLTDIAGEFEDPSEGDEDEDEQNPSGPPAARGEITTSGAAITSSGTAAAATVTTKTSPTYSKRADNNNDGTSEQEEAEEEEEEEGEAEDRLYELYWMFNSYSDTFNRSVYDQISIEDKRKFVCRLFTGQSHESKACDQFLPMVTLYKVASALIAPKN